MLGLFAGEPASFLQAVADSDRGWRNRKRNSEGCANIVPKMGMKVGEIQVLRGSPPVTRTLEVFVDEDFMPHSGGGLTAEMEKCVSFREVSDTNGRCAVIFSRSISPIEARAFSELLRAAADVLDAVSNDPPDSDT